MTDKFLNSRTSPAKDPVADNIYSIGLIKDTKLNNCLRHSKNTLLVEKCPPRLENYTEEYLFKFKKNEVLNIDETKCVTKSYSGDIGFAPKEIYQNGTTNCMKTNLINVFKVGGPQGDMCIGNNLTTATTLNCALSNWTYNFKL